MKGLAEKGVRISLEAEKIAESASIPAEELLSLGKTFITEDDILILIRKKADLREAPLAEAPPAQFIPPSDFRPSAREFGPSLRFHEKLDVTGKSRGSGKVEDFVAYFRDRFERISRLLSAYASKYPEASLDDMKRAEGQKVRSIVMITDIRQTKNNNILMDVEDLKGKFKILFTRREEEAFSRARMLTRDDIIAVYGKATNAFIIVEDFELPDLPVSRDRKLCEKDLAIAYLSDIHFGSNKFVKPYLDGFVDWLHGNRFATGIITRNFRA
ncbi:MAG TPA: hypothetical protein PKJ97_04255, partial [Candidatus Bilamarchaeaceae archaeon]|nr:hypothetical protein [Candidatus Bilamarchaeaceae archaeon]